MLVQAECNISRDRLGKIDLSSWHYQTLGLPGGVMLQIGIHYVLETLMGRCAVCRHVGAAGRQSRCRQPDPGARPRLQRDLQEVEGVEAEWAPPTRCCRFRSCVITAL
jgi:hypothetical protein